MDLRCWRGLCRVTKLTLVQSQTLRVLVLVMSMVLQAEEATYGLVIVQNVQMMVVVTKTNRQETLQQTWMG